MKMITAKLKKSTIVQKAIAGILTSSIALFSAMPVYAGTTVDQETLYPILRNSTTQYLYPVTGTTKTIYRLTNIADILAQFADQSTLNQKSIYTLMNTIKGYVDGIEGYVDGIEGYVDGIEGLITTSNTHLNAIKGYVDGIEGKIDTSNTKLNDIKSAIQNITTYNYTQILNDIFTNTGYLSIIDTYTQSIQDSIGYGTPGDNVLSKLTSLINSNSNIDTNTGNIYTSISNYVGNSTSIHRRYGVNSSIYSTLNVNGLSIPNSAGTDSSNIGSYSMVYSSTTNNNLLDFIGNGNIISNFILSKIWTPLTQYREYFIDDNFLLQARVDNNNKPIAYLSVADMIYDFDRRFDLYLAKLQYSLADDDTISAKNANKTQEQAALNNFTGQGSASASASDFGQLSNAVGSVKSGLNTNASPTDVLTVFNSPNGFGWFSQTTLDELDTTTQNTRNIKAGSDTPLYDSNYNSIMDYLTGGNKK